MKYCPLMSFGKQYSNAQPCLGYECGLAGTNEGDCLIRRFLKTMLNGDIELEISSPEKENEPTFKPPIRSDTLMPWDY